MAVLERTFDPAGLAAPASAPALRALGALLREVGFDEHGAARAVAAPAPDLLLSNSARYAFFADRSRPEGPHAEVALLTSLFVLNRSLPADWLGGALRPELLDLLRELELLDDAGELARGRVSLTPWQGRWFLADRLFHSPAPQQLVAATERDLVMPPHASSLLVLDTLQALRGSVLDVGCGTGFLALNTGAGTDRSAGLDLNPRCVAYATANAVLNRRDEVAFTAGDFADHTLTPDRRFDHLVFNAPTLPRIDDEEGDGEFGQSTMEWLLHAAVAMAPRVLRPGGGAHILGIVEVPADRVDAAETVRDWLAGADVTDVTVTAHDSPLLQVTRRQLEQRRLHGNSLLVYGAGQARRLLDSLARRGTAAVEVVTIGFRTPLPPPQEPPTERQ
ncbi:hypothetical protein DN069_03120 [Streptacidiphilus pinicola]|uniref:Methyltransferase small domain-containing protein n=1 Tax=Streptacidiphilus pinicola TaxID=2219663 RepID=A0A2X0KK92_9ACTN|nr:methyltransferase [Streptacidiphilus pinicola]RAG87120.1 hypothetical protein DN069_03120 [Streptacidiphilus pinicola]